MLVSIIVPAYKQEKTIQEDILNIYNVMESTRWDFEIIVVVDGFLDSTFENAKKIDKPNVKVCGYKTNHGKGYAVRYGMAHSKGDYIAFIDAGMEIDANGISMLLEHMQWYDADVIVGSKRHPASKVKFPPLRRIYSWGYHTMVQLLFRVPVNDTQVGLKVFKRSVLEDVFPRLTVKQYAFDIELLAVCKYLGHSKIYESPVNIKWEASSGTRFKKFLFFEPMIRSMLIDTLGVFYRMYILGYYKNESRRKWKYDEEIGMRINTGEMEGNTLASIFNPKPHSEEELYSNENLKFSIIIPVRAINDFLEENIAHLKRLTYKNFEVLIILDKFEKYDFGGDSRFKLFFVGPKGPGEKRNLGAKESTGDILVFLDDDAYPKEDWLNQAAQIFSEEGIYALGGPAMTPPNASFLERCSGFVLSSPLASFKEVYRHIPKQRRPVNDYPTVNLFVEKNAFFSVGGFTEEFWPGEDTKLCLDLVEKHGRDFLYDPRPVVYHHRRNLFKPHLKQISRYGRHRGQFSKIFPKTSRIPMYFVPSLFVLGLLFGPLVCLLIPPLWFVYLGVLYFYIFLLLVEILKITFEEKSLLTGVFCGFGIVATHVTYGLNFIIGLISKPKLQLRSLNSATGKYLGG